MSQTDKALFVQGSSSDSDDDGVEVLSMQDLQDVAITPNIKSHPDSGVRQDTYRWERGDQSDEDEEDDDDDEEPGSRALLGSDLTRRTKTRMAASSKTRWSVARSIVVDSGPTLLFTTLSLLFSGELLDHVAKWEPMQRIDELLIIIPVVLNLNGNLEMNLSARLATAANVGELDDKQTRRQLILGNLTLLQLQAAVVSLVAAAVAELLGLIIPHVPQKYSKIQTRRPRPALPPTLKTGGFTEFVMVSASSMGAVSLSNFLLGSFMCALILMCRRYGRDPDNIAPPIASCLGDLLTLLLLGLVSKALLPFINTPLPGVITLVIIIYAGICGWFTYRNTLVRPLLTKGWTPLFGAMIISSITGTVLDIFARKYDGFPLLAVVISGLAGSVGSIFVSRLSTALHAAKLLPPPSTAAESEIRKNDFIVMLTLLLITIPLEIIFLVTLRIFGWLEIPIVLAVFSIFFFCIAVLLSLYLGKYLTKLLWFRNLDPDLYALPIHSAFMDLVGQLLLVLTFEIVAALGASVKSHTDVTP